MEEKEDRKYNIIAIAAALLLHGVVCLLMLLSYINYTAPEEQPPLQPKTDITFGGEYVMLGDMPLPNLDNGEAASSTADESSLQAEDEMNSGEQGEGTSLVSTNESSEMSSEKKQNGPSKEELEAQARAKKERERQQNESRRISSDVKGAFGKPGGGKSGSQNGNSDHGALSGQPGHTLGVGYTLSSWGRPASSVDGEVRIRVRVNAAGKVIEATYAGGKGAAAANSQVRRSCEQASLKSRFSVPKNSSGEKVGLIIWRFE